MTDTTDESTERTVEFTLDNLVRMARVEMLLSRYVEEQWRFRYLAAKVAARAVTDDTFMEFLAAAATEPMPEDTPPDLRPDVEPDEPEPGHEEGR